jgi:ketosteroid isomerase-like protein
MDKAKVEKEIMELERKYWRALQENDVETAMELTDFPCIVAGPQGVQRFERDAFEEMMSNAPYKIRKVDIGDRPLVRMVSDDCVVVAYKVHEEATVEGKATSLDAADSSAWVQRDGQWRCALHSEAIAGDSWGRDKKPQKRQARR